jgi:hypothetical protein
MLAARLILVGGLSFGLGLSGCGASNGDGQELAPYAGRFSVIETFNHQDGSSCPPPAQSYENEVEILIDKSDLEARFQTRWPRLYGEILADLSFRATDNDNDPSQAFEITGKYADENGFSGSMKEVWQGCTRWTDLLSDRIIQE